MVAQPVVWAAVTGGVYHPPRLRQLAALVLLASAPDGMTLKELADGLGVTSQDVQSDIQFLSRHVPALYETDGTDETIRYVVDQNAVLGWLARVGFPKGQRG